MIEKLDGLDDYMAQILSDWNAPGIGISVVVGDKSILTKGYGYRDYGTQKPFEPLTLFPIASNTKLFTAIAAAMLVAEGKLTFDEPLRDSIPTFRLHNETLTSTVTLRDLLAHRTGITRHDMIAFKAKLTMAEIFERLRLMQPTVPLRQAFIYNNIMYYAVGHIIELVSGQSWDRFVNDRILAPAGMNSTHFCLEDLLDDDNLSVPFSTREGSNELSKMSYRLDDDPPRPSGSLISTLDDMTRWLRLLMNDGQLDAVSVVPQHILKETLAPAIALPNTLATEHGWWEKLNGTYGLGRQTAVYRGHLMAFHGGDLRGFHSDVSCMVREKIGVAVFVIGDHCVPLRDVVTYHIYERLLGLELTPWSERMLRLTNADKQAANTADRQAEKKRIKNTSPSHPLSEYADVYQHPAYGAITIREDDGQLFMHLRDVVLPLQHYHYERFDSPNDVENGRWVLNFITNALGIVNRFVTAIGENEVVFLRQPPTHSTDLLARLAGTYETATGYRFEVRLRQDETLWLVPPGQTETRFIAHRGMEFRNPSAPGSIFEFIEEHGEIKSMKQTTPRAVHLSRKL